MLLSADEAWIIGRRQNKDGTELQGYNFIINVEKSRTIREKAKIPLYVTFQGGINTHRSLVDIATKVGWMTTPSVGWRCFSDPETGEVIGDNFREKAAYEPEFWGTMLANEKFTDSIKKYYRLDSTSLLAQARQEQEEAEEISDGAD